MEWRRSIWDLYSREEDRWRVTHRYLILFIIFYYPFYIPSIHSLLIPRCNSLHLTWYSEHMDRYIEQCRKQLILWLPLKRCQVCSYLIATTLLTVHSWRQTWRCGEGNRHSQIMQRCKHRVLLRLLCQRIHSMGTQLSSSNSVYEILTHCRYWWNSVDVAVWLICLRSFD